MTFTVPTTPDLAELLDDSLVPGGLDPAHVHSFPVLRVHGKHVEVRTLLARDVRKRTLIIPLAWGHLSGADPAAPAPRTAPPAADGTDGWDAILEVK